MEVLIKCGFLHPSSTGSGSKRGWVVQMSLYDGIYAYICTVGKIKGSATTALHTKYIRT